MAGCHRDCTAMDGPCSGPALDPCFGLPEHRSRSGAGCENTETPVRTQFIGADHRVGSEQ